MDDTAGVIITVGLSVMIVVIFVTLVVVLSSDDEGTIYQGPEGRCELNNETVTCYNIYNREVCKYEYNGKQDGHYC